MAEISPDRTSRWLGTIMPLLTQGGPVVSLLLLLIGSVTIYGMFTEMKRVHALNREVLQLLLAEKDARVELALKMAHCPPAP